MSEIPPESSGKPKVDAAQSLSAAPAQASSPAPTKAAAPTVSPASSSATIASPPPSPLPNPLSHLAIPFQGTDYTLKGYHADASVTPDAVPAAAAQLDREGFSLDTITGVDWLAQNQMELVYDF